MSHDVQWPLQQALYTALTGDAALTALIGASGVFDHVDEGSNLPYVTIGDISQAQFGTKTTEGMDATVTIHTWDDVHRGLKSTKEIMAAVLGVLHEASLSITGHSLSVARFEFSDVFVDPDGLTRHGVQRFRFLTCVNS